MSDPACLLDIRGAVAIATLNRPPVRNALSSTTVHRLMEILDVVAADATVAGLIVTGSGPIFSSGVDLKELEKDAANGDRRELRARVEQTQELTRRIVRTPKIVIAAVNGPAVGMGAELCVAADFRLAAAVASFSFPEVARAVFPTGGVTYLLPRIVGQARAMDWLLTGRTVGAGEALASGLLAEVVEDRPVLDRAMEVLDRIARNAPATVSSIKRVLSLPSESEFEAALTAEIDGLMACAQSPDFAEGIRAFLEKRAPRFSPTAHRS